jgi:ligand-binding sensor domain-containing protein
VYQFDPENETYLPVKEINDLLPKGRVNVIEADGQKRLWLGTHNGLFQLSPVPN